MDVPDRIYRLQDMANLLGVSRITVWRYIRDGRLPRPRKMLGGYVVGWVEADIKDVFGDSKGEENEF